MRMAEGARYFFVAEFTREAPVPIIPRRLLKAGQVCETRELTLDGGERSRSFVADLIHHKNYEYVICKSKSKITQKSLTSKTITVHIDKEVWHGEKTRFCSSNSRSHGTNLAADFQWAWPDPDLPA